MSNDVVVDIPIEDIRAGVRAEIDSDLGGIAAQVFEKGRLRQSIWIYRSKYKDGGYVVYVKAPHSHLVEFGHVQVAKDGKTVLKHVPGKHFLRKARNAVRRKVDAMLQDMMGDAHYGKRR